MLPGHGVPGGKELYGRMQQYLTAAREIYSKSRDGEEMEYKIIRAFHGGVGMLDQQKRFLFPLEKH